MTEEGGLLEANPIWTSPYERHGARLVPLRRSAEQGLFCWRLGSSGLLQHGICRSRLLFWSASFGTGVSALSASLASFLRHFALLLFCLFSMEGWARWGGGGGFVFIFLFRLVCWFVCWVGGGGGGNNL